MNGNGKPGDKIGEGRAARGLPIAEPPPRPGSSAQPQPRESRRPRSGEREPPHGGRSTAGGCGGDETGGEAASKFAPSVVVWTLEKRRDEKSQLPSLLTDLSARWQLLVLRFSSVFKRFSNSWEKCQTSPLDTIGIPKGHPPYTYYLR
jgi:hypothetical protein